MQSTTIKMDPNGAGMSGIFTFQYLPREQLISLLQKLQAENMHLRSQLTDCQERNRILQHTLPSMLQEFLTQTPKTSNENLGWGRMRSPQLITGTINDVRHVSNHTEAGRHNEKEKSDFPLFKVQGTQTSEVYVKSPVQETITSDQTTSSYPTSMLTVQEQQPQRQQQQQQQQPQQNNYHVNEIPFTPVVNGTSMSKKAAVNNSPPVGNMVPSPVTSMNGVDSGEDVNECSYSRTRLDPMRIDLNCPSFRRIEAMILSDPRVVQSRDWTAYTQANEWTRATCSLMSALFTSDEMAQCTVLGRGIKEPRQRLPVDKALYIVAVISKRFDVSPTRVRARMAQKCKDERRKHRTNSMKYILSTQ
ncbi:BEN domain [Fasciola hepatica]|uniref:BEN domain n=1 Tax=Fasciola hepatica TaxID=6192 RepID=A0A4E0RIB5_FASHE|nr:BEN domain [Fasciola hepatica]